MSGVIVLNASYEHHQNVSVPHAIRMLVRRVAVVEDGDPTRPIGTYPWPKVLRLLKYIYAHWLEHTQPRFTRAGMLKRDRHTCRYCKRPGADTMDHVYPESRGGPTSWLNCVTACEECNGRKADRTPEEAGMPLLWEPYIPTKASLA